MKNVTWKMPAPNYSMSSLSLQLNCNSGDQYSSSTTAAAWENCSLTHVFVRRWPAKLHMFLLQISSIYLSHSNFYTRKAQWNAAASVISIHLVIWCNLWCVYCHGNWGQMQTCKTSRKCVSLVQHSRCLFLSHNPKKNSTTKELKML